MKRLLFVLAIFLLSACSLTAQAQSQQSVSDKTPSAVRSTTQEVLLDMVFRDKKGRTIHDIRPEEIHVLEDGVEQKVTSFRLVQGNTTLVPREAAAETVAAAVAPLDPMKELRLITLVFQGLDQNERRFFRQAVKGILDMTPEQNLYFSVLTIDQRLQVIQPFTADHAALLKSIDRSGMWSFTQYENQSAEIKQELRRTLSQGESQGQLISATPGAAPNPSQIQSSVAWRMAKMQYDMLEAAEAADREANARTTMDALLTLVRAESQLPGRKVVLYFNPSLLITETIKEQYAELISAANRSNVSFYTVDPKGLVTSSQESTGRDWLKDATGEVRAQQMAGGTGPVSTSQVRAEETAERALRANPVMWLQDLAQQTGGEAITDTNDWKAPLKTVMDEVRTYYEAAYTPHISVYDGKFRKISVRVDRPNVAVHTRSGYFDLPQLNSGQQLYAYEMPLLKALDAATPPSGVGFQIAAERFNDRGPKIEYMVTLEAPLKGITFAPQSDHKNSSVDAALLAVVKNSRGEIVEKFSKDFAVEVPTDKIDAYKEGNLVQTFRTELFPGSYTLEAAVMDRNDNKMGVRTDTLTVADPSSKLSMSDVVVVRRTDALKDNQMLDAFYFPGGKVVPSLTHTLQGGPGNVLSFYFAVYPNLAVKDSLKLTMSFYKEGQYLGAAEAPLPAVQPDGRIPYIANLPADKFTPGAYEIRMGVTQGNTKAEETVAFQVD